MTTQISPIRAWFERYLSALPPHNVIVTVTTLARGIHDGQSGAYHEDYWASSTSPYTDGNECPPCREAAIAILAALAAPHGVRTP